MAKRNLTTVCIKSPPFYERIFLEVQLDNLTNRVGRLSKSSRTRISMFTWRRTLFIILIVKRSSTALLTWLLLKYYIETKPAITISKKAYRYMYNTKFCWVLARLILNYFFLLVPAILILKLILCFVQADVKSKLTKAQVQGKN